MGNCRTFTDRSRIITYQTCPRKRWLEYHALGAGITLARQSVPLATGTFTHLGLAALLNGEDTDSAVAGRGGTQWACDEAEDSVTWGSV